MRSITSILLLCVGFFGTVRTAHADRRAPAFTPDWAAPQLTADPPDGPPGTQIVIRGPRFHNNVQVFYGNVPMQIVGVGDREIVALVPDGVRGANYIYVVDNTGRARTSVPFQVWAGPPRYATPPPAYAPTRTLSISPLQGEPGTIVRIYGDFGRFADPYYGDRPMIIRERGRGFIVAEVPPDVRGDARISVVTRNGTRFESAAPFELGRRRWRR